MALLVSEVMHSLQSQGVLLNLSERSAILLPCCQKT
jgi:hypothetical protein